jgi:hypothetical protein
MTDLFFLANSPEEAGKIIHDLISLHDSEDEGSPIVEDEPMPPKHKAPVKIELATSPQTHKSGKRAAATQSVKPVSRIRVESPQPATPSSARTPRQSKKGKGKKRQTSPSSAASPPKVRTFTRQELEGQIPRLDLALLPLMGSTVISRSFVSLFLFSL